MGKRRIVISAVNFYQGGPLSILYDCVGSIMDNPEYEVFILLHKKELLYEIDPDIENKVRLLEFPRSRKSWIYRLFYEYVYFRRLSAKLDAFLWFSLHDISPNITAIKKAVYCHNPAPFYKTSVQEMKMAKGFFIFSVLYKYLYKINLHKNNFVVVQQQWIRDKFAQMYGIRKQKIIVAYPTPDQNTVTPPVKKPGEDFMFLYPALPRVFKNFEVILEALNYLTASKKFKIVFTINGEENPYAEAVKKMNKSHAVEFRGLQSKSAMRDLYRQADCLLFPSKLETWGLPLSEAKLFGLPIVAADLPYAHEAVGNYDAVSFFHPEDPRILACIMDEILNGRQRFSGNRVLEPAQPFVRSWDELFKILMN